MFARYASAVSAGTLMTFALLYAMQGLIDLQPGATSEGRTRAIVPWIHVAREAAPPPPPESLVDKETLTRAPVPPIGKAPAGGPEGFYIPVRPAGPEPIDTRLDRLSNPDNPLISIVRVQPTYPAIAEQRGLEGWVDVRFDVMTSGQVMNIEVTASSDRIFEKAAIKAAQRFRFKAPVVNGVPQVATGVDYRFRFEMND
ncbi:MAG: energy transducer TonB [Gammaproteobacteria bacterium]|nr:energy transducer TonB [Gammaproteobacteria bacterium]MDH5619418.1 energy transducer TonB [Gammaproteobacteria bacterium]